MLGARSFSGACLILALLAPCAACTSIAKDLDTVGALYRDDYEGLLYDGGAAASS